MFLVILVALGVWTSLKSRARLEKIRERKRVLKDRESEKIRSSKEVNDLLGDIAALDEY